MVAFILAILGKHSVNIQHSLIHVFTHNPFFMVVRVLEPHLAFIG